MMLNIVLLGPPGSGKGTQCEKLIEKYGLVPIATGDLFRKHAKEGTPLGRNVGKYMEEGLLVPDEIVIGMMKKEIEENLNARGIIFDGFPRSVAQARALDDMLAEKRMLVSTMICLDVADSELVNRIRKRAESSGRIDDQDEDKIKKRIEVYKEETLPVTEHYRKQGKFLNISGMGEINDIFQRTCRKIEDTLG